MFQRKLLLTMIAQIQWHLSISFALACQGGFGTAELGVQNRYRMCHYISSINGMHITGVRTQTRRRAPPNRWFNRCMGSWSRHTRLGQLRNGQDAGTQLTHGFRLLRLKEKDSDRFQASCLGRGPRARTQALLRTHREPRPPAKSFDPSTPRYSLGCIERRLPPVSCYFSTL